MILLDTDAEAWFVAAPRPPMDAATAARIKNFLMSISFEVERAIFVSQQQWLFLCCDVNVAAFFPWGCALQHMLAAGWFRWRPDACVQKMAQ